MTHNTREAGKEEGDKAAKWEEFSNFVTLQRQQAVAEFAREVVALVGSLSRTTEPEWIAKDLQEDIHTLLKERGINLD